MKRVLLIGLMALLALGMAGGVLVGLAGYRSHEAPKTAANACAAAQVRVAVASEAGDFAGMSHDGVRLALNNTGAAACTLPSVPLAQLRGEQGQPLAVRLTLEGAPPAAMDVAVPAGGVVSGTLYWVSGPVFDDSSCAEVGSVTLTSGSMPLAAPLPFRAHLCGPAKTGPEVRIGVFS